jgi:hypothetical protein
MQQPFSFEAHSTSSKKVLLNLTMAGGRSLSTAFLTRFEVILSMIVRTVAQVLYQSFAEMAPKATAKSSVASQGGCGWAV